jgi:hypothetical protein
MTSVSSIQHNLALDFILQKPDFHFDLSRRIAAYQALGLHAIAWSERAEMPALLVLDRRFAVRVE